MQTAFPGLCGAGGAFWFLSLLLPCDLYAATLQKSTLFTGIVGGGNLYS